MHKDAVIRAYWLAAILIAGLALLVRLYVLVGTPGSGLADIVDFIYDDGYYYLTIAANMVDLGRSTFDGITATNGYQPLWLLILACLARLVGTDTRTLFVASCALIYVTACFTPLLALFWWKSAARVVAMCIAAGLATIVIQQPTVFLEGLEPILLAPAAIALVVLIEHGEDRPATFLKLSAVLALAFLVRLDALSLFMSTVILLPVLASLGRAGRVRSAAAALRRMLVPLSTFVLPTAIAYALVNQWLFGSPVPVSGRAKSIGGPAFSNWGVIQEILGHWRPLALLIAVVLALEFLCRRFAQRPQPLFYRSIAIVSVAITIQCAYYALLSTWHVWPWYQYLVALNMALLVARILYLASLFELRPRTRFIGIAVVLWLCLWTGYRGFDFAFQSLAPAAQARVAFAAALGISPQQMPGTISQGEANLLMLKEFFDPQAATLIAMGDRSGALAYWGRGKVRIIQTEGLALDAGYVDARVLNRGAEYLERFPIEYFVIDREVILTEPGPDGQARFVVPDPIQGRVTTAPVPTFCFPQSAIRYRKRYESGYGSGAAASTRVAFLFAARVPCSDAALRRLREIETGIGLRQFSLPSEYDSVPGGMFNKSSEDRDRHYRGKPADISSLSRE